MRSFDLTKPEGFSLSAAAEFYQGFVPGSGMAAASVGGSELTLAFRVDETFVPVVASLREEGKRLIVTTAGKASEAEIEKPIGRMLGLDAPDGAWLDLGAREPLVGRLQAEFPGFFTAAKSSPYDAATWGVIAPRMSTAAAASVKKKIAAKHGDVLTLHGVEHRIFPSPATLLALDEIEGLPAEKVARLHGIARAALDGKLDAERLRAMQPADALAELQSLRGVGPWTAGHIYHRGAAVHDALPLSEPRVLHGFASVLGVSVPSVTEFARAAEAWRPLRMWVCVLLARHLQRVGGWNRPGLRSERAALAKVRSNAMERSA